MNVNILVVTWILNGLKYPVKGQYFQAGLKIPSTCSFERHIKHKCWKQMEEKTGSKQILTKKKELELYYIKQNRLWNKRNHLNDKVSLNISSIRAGILFSVWSLHVEQCPVHSKCSINGKYMLNKWMNFIVIKGLIHKEDMTILNTYAPNNILTKYIKQNLTDCREEKISLQLEWGILIYLSS